MHLNILDLGLVIGRTDTDSVDTSSQLKMTVVHISPTLTVRMGQYKVKECIWVLFADDMATVDAR